MLFGLVLPLLSTAALAAAQLTNLTSTGCADASGFQSCQNSANQKLSSCIAQANKDNSQTELLACGCVNYVDNYNCYATHCWNRVWECEYQEYIIEYLLNCPTGKLPVPYFPAPDNAADACSCNLGKVFLAVENAIQEGATCTNNANSGDALSNLQRIQGCECCEVSGGLSALFEICPSTNPSLIGLSRVQQLETNLNVQFSSCGQYMAQYDCVSALSFSLDGVSTYLAPNDPVHTGTATLSNIAGTVTAPPGGPVFTYTNGGDGVVYTISAAGKNAGSGNTAVAAGGSDQGSATGSGGAKATGSAKNIAESLTISKSLLGAIVSVIFTLVTFL